MLSRLALRSSRVPALLQQATTSSLSTSAKSQVAKPPPVAAENPERDLVNFPRRTYPIDNPKVRLGFLPEEWFTFFYDKTGVTGPYMFLAGLSTYMVSKEIYIIEHEFFAGVGLFILWGYIIKRFGPDVKNFAEKLVEKEEAFLKSIRQDEIDRCQAAIEEEEKSQWMATSYESLIQAKKDNVALQLEVAYRERLQKAYELVKNRLDYQMELTNVMRRVEQKHMVDWIISNVKKSITAKQEDDALKKCIQDLKTLAA